VVYPLEGTHDTETFGWGHEDVRTFIRKADVFIVLILLVRWGDLNILELGVVDEEC